MRRLRRESERVFRRLPPVRRETAVCLPKLRRTCGRRLEGLPPLRRPSLRLPGRCDAPGAAEG